MAYVWTTDRPQRYNRATPPNHCSRSNASVTCAAVVGWLLLQQMSRRDEGASSFAVVLIVLLSQPNNNQSETVVCVESLYMHQCNERVCSVVMSQVF